MLRAMRTGVMSGVFLAILLLGGIGLVLTGSGSYFQGNLASTTVAEAGDTAITISQFDRMARRQLSQQGVSLQQAYRAGMMQRLLDQQIDRTLLYQHARHQGVQVGPNILRERINRLLGPGIGDNSNRKEALDRFLQARGMRESELIRLLRQDISNSLMRDIIMDGTKATSDAITTPIAQWKAETRDIYAVKLPHSRISDIKAPGEDELKNYYQKIRDQFSIPERRDFTIALLKRETVAEQIDISKSRLRQYYADNKASYKQPEKRKIRQAVFDEKQTAKMVARRAAKHDIALKQATRDVTGTDRDYMGKQVFRRSGLSTAITEPVFSADPGDTVGPVKSALGWHVINVEETIKASTRSFDLVKDKLRNELRKERIGDELFQLSRELDDKLIGGEKLDRLAKDYNLDLKKFDAISQDGTTKDGEKILKDIPEQTRRNIIDQVFSLEETGFPSQVASYEDGYFTVRLDRIKDKSFQAFKSVRDQVREQWNERQRHLKNLDEAKATLEKLNGGDLRLGAVARQNGTELLEFNNVQRSKPPKKLTRNAIIRAFKLKENEYGYVGGEISVIFMKLDEINMPAADALDEADLKQARSDVTQQFQNEMLSRYVDGLRSQYEISINRKLLERRYATQDGS